MIYAIVVLSMFNISMDGEQFFYRQIFLNRFGGWKQQFLIYEW